VKWQPALPDAIEVARDTSPKSECERAALWCDIHLRQRGAVCAVSESIRYVKLIRRPRSGLTDEVQQ
jgi:hypothetical protein